VADRAPGSASANAPNPVGPTTGAPVGTATENTPGGPVTVTLSGKWSWDSVASDEDGGAKSSPQLQCAQRYGIGWAVDWWGTTAQKSPAPAFSVTNDAYQLAPGGTSPQNTPVAFTSGPKNSSGPAVPGYAGPITVFPTGGIQIHSPGGPGGPGNQTFWVGGAGGDGHQAATGYAGGTNAVYDGYDAPLCPTSSGPSGQVDANGAPVGTWSARATYPSAADVPAELCINFYDMHQKQGQPPKAGGNDWSPAQDGDNSIQTNDYNPNVGGNCFKTPTITTPSGTPVTPAAAPVTPASTPPSISVNKLNDADGTGYAKSEMAKAPGQAVPFLAVVTNDSPEAVRITSLTDTYSGQTITPDCHPNLVGTVLAAKGQPGSAADCTFTIDHYAPPAGQSLTDTVTVRAEVAASSNSATGSSDSAAGASNSTAGASNSTAASSSSTAASSTSTVTTPAPAPAPAPQATSRPAVKAATRPAAPPAPGPAPARPAVTGASALPPAPPGVKHAASPTGLAFTGAPAGLRIMVMTGLSLLLVGAAALWLVRRRRAGLEA
jgi:hypothetical protein